jgi:hypothetical protein
LLSPDAALIAATDKRLKDWNQGDVVLGDVIPCVHLADYSRPITSASRTVAGADAGGSEALGTVVANVPGVVVLTQSCELVHSCQYQPFIKFAVLQEVDQDFLDHVRKGHRPRYAYVPSVADRKLVANLDAVVTVEKTIVHLIKREDRIAGCRTDSEIREFAFALARNLSRFAFPDDFSNAMKRVRDRILKKHDKPTDEGKLLSALREIRVACFPSWSATPPFLTFYFIFDDRAVIPPDGDIIVEDLLKKFKPTGPFKEPQFRLITLSEMSAETYNSSQPLDLDHLSQASAPSDGDAID